MLVYVVWVITYFYTKTAEVIQRKKPEFHAVIVIMFYSDIANIVIKVL